MNQVSAVGLDLAKYIFQLHGADRAGAVVFRKKLRRGQLLAFLATLPPCTVAMEACASAHYWGREIAKLGHTVRLGVSQSFGVYGSLSLRAVSAPPNRRGPMILSAIAEKLKRRSKDDFKGRHFEAALILQAVSWYLRYPLSYRDIEELFLERGLEVDHSREHANSWG